MSIRFSLSLALAALAGLADRASAQCVPFGTPCTSSGMRLVCGNPRIGTSWLIGEQDARRCGNPTTMFTLFGGCLSPGIPIGSPIACANCGVCEWLTVPTYATLQWNWPPRSTNFPIPNDPNLVGAMSCIQNVRANLPNNCACLSGAMQVTIVP